MDYTNLGTSGLRVSRICLGCMGFGTKAWREWIIEEDASRVIVKRALELGINFFDTADAYSHGASESILGRALRDYASREQVVIATKVFYPTGSGPNDRGLSRKHLFDAIDRSLRNLETDYVDLYQIHRWDPRTPIEETLRALDDLVQAGKVRYIGASSCFAWELAQALALSDRRGWTRFISMQNHYNLVYREEEREMLPLCEKEGLGVIPWSPLARGLLSGTRTRRDDRTATTRARTDDFTQQMYTQDSDDQVVAQCVSVAARRGVPPAQVALAWLLHRGVAAPILGVTKLEHLEQGVGAVGLALEPREIEALEAPYRPHPVLGIDLLPRR